MKSRIQAGIDLSETKDMVATVAAHPTISVELQRIAEANGGVLRPEVVVSEARPADSPLHRHFQWDDDKAADAYRIHQARQLIRVAVAYSQVGNNQVACRVFVSLTPDREEDGGGYRVLSAVLSDEDMRRQLLADAKKEMRIFKDRYDQLVELADVFKAMERVDQNEAIPA